MSFAAVAALAWGLAYLAWRAVATWHGAQPAMFGALYVSEVFGWLMLASFAFLAWRIPRSERPVIGWRPSVDVFVCTYDEPVEILTATLVGCGGMTYPHQTWVLDDGHRDDVRDLAQRFGVGYLTRPTNEHAKAGNLNHALGCTDGQLVAVLDADHVPQRDFLDATVGYFDDPSVALVQTPHDFSNQDSFQHFEAGRHDQSMFFHVIMPGKDRHNGAFWCGSAAVVLRRALEDIGGIATQTIAEDFHTTIRLHKAGWRTRYHNEVLVQGLAPHDLGSFVLQRDRWANGNLTVIRTPENPVIAGGLTMKQRASYLSSLLGYFVPVQRLVLLAVLVVMLTTGLVPLRATPGQLLVLWAPWMALEIGASALLCRGETTLWDGACSTLLTSGVYLRSIVGLFRPIGTTFSVTPKEGVDSGGWRAIARLRLVATMGAALVVAVSLRLLSMAGMVRLPPLGHLPLAVGLLFASWELALIAATLARVGTRHQLRRRFRVPVELTGSLDGSVVRVVDLTPRGAGLLGPIPLERGSTSDLRVKVPLSTGELRPMRLTFTVSSCRAVPDVGWRVGGALEARSRLDAEALVDHCHLVRARSRLITSGRLRPSADTPKVSQAPRPAVAPGVTAKGHP